MNNIRAVVMVAVALASGSSCAKDAQPSNAGPEAGGRTYAQNYKDMVLATCVAKSFKGDKDVAKDVGSSVSALRDWTEYDLEKSTDEVQGLIDKYLDRDYSNPLAESEVPGIRFDFLKCLDLYHSQELEILTKSLVGHPNHTYRQDKAAMEKQK